MRKTGGWDREEGTSVVATGESARKVGGRRVGQKAQSYERP